MKQVSCWATRTNAETERVMKESIGFLKFRRRRKRRSADDPERWYCPPRDEEQATTAVPSCGSTRGFGHRRACPEHGLSNTLDEAADRDAQNRRGFALRPRCSDPGNCAFSVRPRRPARARRGRRSAARRGADCSSPGRSTAPEGTRRPRRRGWWREPTSVTAVAAPRDGRAPAFHRRGRALALPRACCSWTTFLRRGTLRALPHVLVQGGTA